VESARKPTQGVDAYAGVTADQIAAAKIGQDTLLPSLELATEDQAGLIGACDRDYGCIYMNTLSWRTPTTPMPMEINPRKVFERMFGQGGSAAERLARTEEDRSILDAITHQIVNLQRSLGQKDRRTVNDYLDSVREIERRIQVAEKEQHASLELPDAPVGIPFSFEEHITLIVRPARPCVPGDITACAPSWWRAKRATRSTRRSACTTGTTRRHITRTGRRKSRSW